MGRKGQAGGSAGGGRSGRKGGLTYTRVIPKFLQRLAGPDYTSNPVDAKRHTMQPHPDDVDVEPSRLEREKQRDKQRDNASEGDVNAEIRRLEADGFNVVEQPVEAENGRTDHRLGESANQSTRVGVSGKRGDSQKKLGVRGGIEKKHVSTALVAKAFSKKNRQKLSFAESDSDSESA